MNGRRELESLFELQPRAAQQLLALLPTVTVGTSRLVEAEDLRGFLDRMQVAPDVNAEIEAVRQEKKGSGRRRLRTLVQTDDPAVSLSSPPGAVTLRRGKLEVDFGNLEELAAAMYWLARALDGELEAFATQYEPEQMPSGRILCRGTIQGDGRSVGPSEAVALGERNLRRAAP